jgi:hypothetical protein
MATRKHIDHHHAPARHGAEGNPVLRLAAIDPDVV